MAFLTERGRAPEGDREFTKGCLARGGWMAMSTCRHCGYSLLAEGAEVCPQCGGVDPAGIPWGAWFSTGVCSLGVILVVGSFFTKMF